MNKILIIAAFIIILNCGEEKLNIYDSQDYLTTNEQTFIKGEKVYNRSCSHCHARGVAGARTMTNYNYWNNIASQGMKKVYTNVEKGYNGIYGVMPPKGNCLDCDEDQLKASIYFMLFQAEKNKPTN